MIRAAFGIVLFCTTAILRGAEAPVDYSNDPDVIELSRIRHFVLGGSIFSSRRTKGEALLARILARDDKIRPLIEVYNRGTPEAQTYALAAFHHLAPGIFEQCKKDLVGKYNPMVRHQHGCLSGDGTLLEFLVYIHHGRFDQYIKEYADPEEPKLVTPH